MANPIKVTDIYQHGDEIQKGIADLEAMNKAYEELIKTLKNQSIQLETTVKKSSVATGSQRQALSETAKQVEEIERRFDKYSASLGENATKIAALKNAQRDLNTVNKATAKLNAAAEGSYNKLSAQYTLNKLRLNQMSAEMRKNTKEGQRLEKQTREIFEEMKALQEATGKHVLSVGDYGKALRGLHGPLGQVVDFFEAWQVALKRARVALAATSKGLNLFKIALVSTGIGAIVVALGSLVALLLQTQKGLDFVNRALTALRAGFDVIIDRAALLGEAIVDLFAGRFQESARKAREAFQGIGKEIRAETQAAANLTKEMQNQREERRALEVQIEKQRATIKRLNQEGENTELSPARRTKALKEAFNIEKNLLSLREDLIRRELKTLQDQNALGNSLTADLDKVAEKEIELAKAQQESLELQTTLGNKLNAIRKEASSQQRKQLEEAERAREKQNAEIQEIVSLVEEADAKLAGSGFQAQRAYEKAIEKIEELQARAEQLGLTLDFSSLRTTELNKLNEALEKIRGNILQPISLPKDNPRDFVKELGMEIKNIQSQTQSGGQQSIFDSLGFSTNQVQGLKSTFQSLKSLLSELTQERIKAADAAVEAANREVSAAENNLSRQIQLQGQFQANKREQAEEELQLAQRNQRRALREQRRAARQQRAIQAIQQTGNLITASSKIWAQLGFPFALPAIGVLWGSFIASKVRAASLAKDERRSGSFELFNYGSSHQSGKDINLGVTPDGKQRTVERDEAMAIFSKNAVRKYRSVLPSFVNAINTGALASNFFKRNSTPSVVFVDSGGGSDMSTTEKELSAIRRQGERHFYTDANGNHVVIDGNIETTYI